MVVVSLSPLFDSFSWIGPRCIPVIKIVRLSLQVQRDPIDRKMVGTLTVANREVTGTVGVLNYHHDGN